jgi:uncharacterized membrane protein YkgB
MGISESSASTLRVTFGPGGFVVKDLLMLNGKWLLTAESLQKVICWLQEFFIYEL